MDLDLGGKIAVVTGASKGIGLAVVRALAAEGVASRRAHGRPARSTASTASPPSRSTWPKPAVRRPRRPRARRARPARRAGQQRGRRAAAARGLPRDQRRRLRVGAADELLHRAAGDARRRRAHGQRRAAGRSSTSPRSTPSSSPDGAAIDYGAAKAALVNLPRRCLRNSARAASASTTSPRAGRDRSVARRARRRATRSARPWEWTPQRVRDQADGGIRHRPVHHAGGGGDARRDPRVPAHRERHRLQLRHRRRTREDALSRSVSVQRRRSGGR